MSEVRDAAGHEPGEAVPSGQVGATGDPYPDLLSYQMLTPTAPLAPGAAIRVVPGPIGPAGLASVPPAWAPDPTARHQWRWWGGVAWTDHVADDGTVGRDPLDRP